MANTIRERIIQAIIAKLADIRTARGFATDLGSHVYRAAMTIPTDQTPAVSVIPGVEECTKSYAAQLCVMPMRILGITRHLTENPSVVAERMLGDIIRCLLEPELVLPFFSGSRAPVVGELISGATSLASATVLQVTVAAGSWAAGTAAGTIHLRDQGGTFVDEVLSVTGAADCASISGDSVPGPGFVAATAGLADEMAFLGGGTEDYPESIDIATTVTAVFRVNYRTVIGNPYEQPS